MYNVTSAVIQALRTALLYPLDDPNPRHRMANRKFFEAQMDRFLRPEARLRDIQSSRLSIGSGTGYLEGTRYLLQISLALFLSFSLALLLS